VSAKATRRELNARQAETVERVAAAAREELRAVGFDGLTIRSVAGRASVAPATAYTYFSSKNHLIAEIFWRRLVERPHLEQGSATSVAAVIAVFTDLVEFI
jgi:AcrR family transcriptional regulator